jgi:hypothetical protein
MKKNDEVIGEDPAIILPVDRFSSRNSLQACILMAREGRFGCNGFGFLDI